MSWLVGVKDYLRTSNDVTSSVAAASESEAMMTITEESTLQGSGKKVLLSIVESDREGGDDSS